MTASQPGWSITLDEEWKEGAVLARFHVGDRYVGFDAVAAALEDMDDAQYYQDSAVLWVEADDGHAAPLWVRRNSPEDIDVFDVQAWSMWLVPDRLVDGKVLAPHMVLVLENKLDQACEIPFPPEAANALLDFIHGCPGVTG
jgi:hypothetical protein